MNGEAVARSVTEGVENLELTPSEFCFAKSTFPKIGEGESN